MLQQIIARRPKDTPLATAPLQQPHLSLKQLVVTCKQKLRHSTNPLRSLLFRPVLRRSCHSMQVAFHVVIIEQTAKTTTLASYNFFDKTYPIPQPSSTIRNK